MTKNQINCKFLLCSGPLGEDWRKYDFKNLLLKLPPQQSRKDKFTLEQQQLASIMRIEFIDLAQVWNDYLGKSQKPWQWFHRDNFHGNDRGKQIVGRILERYFSLK